MPNSLSLAVLLLLTYCTKKNELGPDSTDSSSGGMTDAVPVAPAPVSPSVQDGRWVTMINTSLTATLHYSAKEKPNLEFRIVKQPGLGKIVAFDGKLGTVLYEPNPNAFGLDSFQYMVSDGNVSSNIGTTKEFISMFTCERRKMRDRRGGRVKSPQAYPTIRRGLFASTTKSDDAFCASQREDTNELLSINLKIDTAASDQLGISGNTSLTAGACSKLKESERS